MKFLHQFAFEEGGRFVYQDVLRTTPQQNSGTGVEQPTTNSTEVVDNQQGLTLDIAGVISETDGNLSSLQGSIDASHYAEVVNDSESLNLNESNVGQAFVDQIKADIGEAFAAQSSEEGLEAFMATPGEALTRLKRTFPKAFEENEDNDQKILEAIKSQIEGFSDEDWKSVYEQVRDLDVEGNAKDREAYEKALESVPKDAETKEAEAYMKALKNGFKGDFESFQDQQPRSTIEGMIYSFTKLMKRFRKMLGDKLSTFTEDLPPFFKGMLGQDEAESTKNQAVEEEMERIKGLKNVADWKADQSLAPELKNWGKVIPELGVQEENGQTFTEKVSVEDFKEYKEIRRSVRSLMK